MKKKVLQVSGNLMIGGAETVAMNVYRYIDRDKFEFHYLVFDERIGDYEQEVLDLGGKVIRISRPKEGIMRFIREFNRVLKDCGPYQAVHSHIMFSSGIIDYVAHRNGVPVIVTHSHTIKNKINENVGMILYENVMRILIKKCSTEYLACSQNAGEYLYGKKFYKKYGMLVKNGIQVQKYKFDLCLREKTRQSLGVTDEKVIGNVGHFHNIKNQEFLIRVFSEMLKVNGNLRLLLIGDGALRDWFEDLAEELGIKDKVLMPGFKDNVCEYLSAMDVFAMPSLYEGFGIAALEAQANGLPCIISDSMPDEVCITDLVTVVSLKNRKEWMELLLKEKRKNTAYYNEAVTEKGYDIEKIGAVFEKLYDMSGDKK